jgi:hypothetical protein
MRLEKEKVKGTGDGQPLLSSEDLLLLKSGSK